MAWPKSKANELGLAHKADLDTFQTSVTTQLAELIEQVQSGSPVWAGTFGGSVNSYTATLDPELDEHKTGMVLRGIVNVTSNTTTPTLNAGPGAKTIVYPDTSALVAGALEADTVYNFLDDGTNWRVFGATGYRAQANYDLVNPVGRIILLGTDDDPNNSLPAGVSATWSEINKDETRATALALRDSATVGDDEGVDSVPLPNHAHTFSDNLGTRNDVSIAGNTDVVNDSSVSGTTSNPTTNPDIAMNPRVHIVRAWQRTA